MQTKAFQGINAIILSLIFSLSLSLPACKTKKEAVLFSSEFKTKAKPLVQISAEPCRGKCPAFEAIFYSNNTMFFKGLSNIKPVGMFTYEVPKAMIDSILADAAKIKYASIAKTYAEAPDFPATHSIITLNGQTYKADVWANAPKPLSEFHTRLINEVRGIVAEQKGTPVSSTIGQ